MAERAQKRLTGHGKRGVSETVGDSCDPWQRFEETWSGVVRSRVFGCRAHAHIVFVSVSVSVSLPLSRPRPPPASLSAFHHPLLQSHPYGCVSVSIHPPPPPTLSPLWLAVAIQSGRGTTSTMSTEREASMAAPITVGIRIKFRDRVGVSVTVGISIGFLMVRFSEKCARSRNLPCLQNKNMYRWPHRG